MNQLLSKEKQNECEICAYHEAGHILFAYLCGYHCMEAQLISEDNEEGFSSFAIIDYGKGSFFASKFTSGENQIDFFKSLPLAPKLEALEVGRRLARIFLGGSVTAAVYQNGGNALIPLPIQVDYLDLVKVEFIHYVIKEISGEKDENFIEHGLQEALYTVGNINVWETIADLSQRLMKWNLLQKNDIEECLEEHGITIAEGSGG